MCLRWLNALQPVWYITYVDACQARPGRGSRLPSSQGTEKKPYSTYKANEKKSLQSIFCQTRSVAKLNYQMRSASRSTKWSRSRCVGQIMIHFDFYIYFSWFCSKWTNKCSKWLRENNNNKNNNNNDKKWYERKFMDARFCLLIRGKYIKL